MLHPTQEETQAQRDKRIRQNGTWIVTTGTVPSREITICGSMEVAAQIADETNGSYRREGGRR